MYIYLYLIDHKKDAVNMYSKLISFKKYRKKYIINIS